MRERAQISFFLFFLLLFFPPQPLSPTPTPFPSFLLFLLLPPFYGRKVGSQGLRKGRTEVYIPVPFFFFAAWEDFLLELWLCQDSLRVDFGRTFTQK